MYVWKCCRCLRFNHSELYDCPLCLHKECEFCIPSAGPNASPNTGGSGGVSGLASLLKRNNDLNAAQSGPKAIKLQPLAEESAEEPSQQPADESAKEQVDQQAEHPTEHLADQSEEPAEQKARTM